MLQALVSTASQLFHDFHRSFRRHSGPVVSPRPSVSASRNYLPLKRLLLTDGVAHTLFEEYAEHRAAARGEEETGWVLLGLREEDEAVVLATLPAGTERDAGIGHVQFNSNGQAVGSRIVRQYDRRLTILGVVHTHPGSLRHPSDADFRGDSEWVRQLRGREGVFGIGTSDGDPNADATLFAQQPKPHVQCMGVLRLSWYALLFGDGGYRPLSVELTLGPDLARPLHSVWPMIEAHADRLDRLHRQQAGVTFEVTQGEKGPALEVHVPLAEPDRALRVLLEESGVHYYLERNGELLAADCQEDRVDRGVYLLLAELTAPS